ncbi:type IV pilus assembly protein PilM [Bacillus oleivorans]|uniref:Type IV pilus assembly protein PilM n=1 Tax=Bacillus oleivorans TaxID=1448271 RepID=A0A285CVF9_9BACI|nr:pilus assembly protein PilM [Bacillus oleivorans]SNX71550.1 type IV pilus assembly protein PilM [Bacillus oleivorans]
MSGLIRKKHHRVNIIINDRFVRFVEAGKNTSIIKYGQRSVPSGLIVNGLVQDQDDFTLFLHKFVKESRIKGRLARFCVPDSQVIVRQTSVPVEIPDDEIKGHLYFQLGQSIHLPFEDPIIEAVPHQIRNGDKEVILVASKESVVQQYQQVIDKAKLHPEAADLTCLSYYRLYYHLDLARPQEHLLLVQINPNSLQLSVFHEHKPVILRQIPLVFDEEAVEVHHGRNQFDQLVWKGNSRQLDEILTPVMTEIRRMMDVYRSNLAKGQYEINKLLIVGDHPCVNLLSIEINAQLSQEVHAFTEPLFQTRKNVNVPAFFSDCIGLALK